MTYVALLNSKHVVDRHALRLIHKFDKHCHVLTEEKRVGFVNNNPPYGIRFLKNNIALSLTNLFTQLSAGHRSKAVSQNAVSK